MYYMLSEGKENNIISREIILEDFDYLTKEDSFIVRKILLGDQILKKINFPEHIINTAVDIIINSGDINNLYTLLEENGVPLYSLIISPIRTAKNKYKEYKKFIETKKIIIECNKNNLAKALEVSKKLNKKIVIEGTSISLKEYKKILSNYNIDLLDNIDLEIIYQNQSSPINIKELYITSLVVEEISNEIEKYNLSTLEKILYTYDIVKSRVYKECDKDKDSARDLNKILETNYTVCVGYSNLFTAILKNLNINAIPLVSTKTKHQRSLVYIKDDKYKIDGVYAFDATYDSRRNSKYINNYNYFGILPSDSEKETPSNLYDIINISFEDLIELYQEKDIIKRIYTIEEKELKIKDSFEFINQNNYNIFEELIKTYKFISKQERDIVHNIYYMYNSKYNPKKIPSASLLRAIYKVRTIEYYNGIINSINIEEISDSVIDRIISQKQRYTETKDEYERLYEILNETAEVHEIVNEEMLKNKNIIERQNLNIKLLKLLRNK